MKHKKMNEKKKTVLIMGLFAIFIFITSLSINIANITKTVNANTDYLTSANKNYRYLSDLDYIVDNNWSYNGWTGHDLQKDKNQEGGALSLIVDGEVRTFTKGLGIHATGQMTFDISELSTQFPRFIAKIGLDASKGNNGGLWIQILVSNDGNSWESLIKTGVLNGTSEAIDVDVNVKGYKYLRIHVNANGSNGYDHGTIGNARLVKEDFEKEAVSYDKLKELDYYDNILSQYDANYNLEHNYRLILEREFVNKVGYWTIQDKAEIFPEYVDTLNWILSSDENLEQIIEVGEVRNGNIFLETLHTLYSNFKDDLQTKNGYVYKKMMIALAAAYRTDNVSSPLTFSSTPKEYDFVERFRLMKLLFDTGKFDREEEFTGYHVELMRFIMQDAISNEELIWLNEYSRTKANPYDKYSYIRYRYGPKYNQPEYQNLANKEKYDTKYLLSQYNVPYGDGVVRYWMAFEYGGICWNISRIGQTINKIKGVPSVGIYQPDHEAYIIYSQRADGTGIWNQNYNIFGWGKSSTKWWGGNRFRLLFNWADKSFANQVMSSSNYGTSSGYLLLGQAALNRREEWTKSLYLNYLANSYPNNTDKLNIYNQALESLDINLDSFDYILNLYKRNNATNEQWHELADKIIEAYTYYPNAMYDLLKVIKPYLKGVARVDIDLKEQAALTVASKATDADVLQSGPTREIANTILGRAKQELATFSFDGENAGKIIINSAYEAYDFNLSYSVDGGQTYSEKTTSHVLTLTPEELATITEENDIKIRMDGTPQVYTIDITTSTLPSNLYGNDLENRVVGITVDYEWRNSEKDSWTSYKTASPNNTGNKTLYVRMGAKGTKLPSESTSFEFTEDNQPNKRKYVSVSHLSIHAYSTQSQDSKRPYYAPNAIDGNGNTFWHTDYADDVRDNAIKPFITIKLDKPRYISALEFQQTLDPKRPDDPDFIKNARIYVSEDGEKWILAGTIENCLKDRELRVIDFDESIYGEYVKIEMDTYNMFTSLSLVNIFQDLTKNPRPTAGIGYSTTNPTRENVIARLVNVSAQNYDIIDENDNVITDSGDTHVFTDNGKYIFRFRDRDTGVIGSSEAVVNWIDRKSPTATIEYSVTSPTNKSVFAVLKPSEDVIVTNNTTFSTDEQGRVLDAQGNVLEGYTVDEKGYVKRPDGAVVGNINTMMHEFMANGIFIFEFEDRAGNKGTATATVTWIDSDTPNAILKYNINSKTNQDVTVTVEFDKEVTITNNGGSDSYTFSKNGEFTFNFEDEAGNASSITAKVDWIDKVAPKAELTYETVGDKVIVRVINPSKKITFQNGNGIYEFTENGNYDIIFFDELGNKGKVTAIITGLDKKPEDINKPSDNDNNDKPDDGNKPSDNDNNQGNHGNSGSANKPGGSTQNNTSKPNSTGNANNNYLTGNETIDDKPTVDNPTTEKPDEEQDDPSTDKKDPVKDDNTENKADKNEEMTDKENDKSNRFTYPIVIITCVVLIVAGIGMLVIRKGK